MVPAVKRALRNAVLLGILILIVCIPMMAQTSADTVRVTFRAHQPSSPTVYVPGQFNGWVSNTGVSAMTYDATLGAWLKTYDFKIHVPGDPNRTLGDSAYQYKFNRGGVSTGWYPDPLNPEQNPADNNNSVLRMSRLVWFEILPTEVSSTITRLTASLIHTNAMSVSSVMLSTGETQLSALTTTDVTSSFNPTNRVFDYPLPAAVPRANYMRLVARMSSGDSVVYARGGIVVPQVPMPAYAKHGVTLPSPASNDSATFRLRVPMKDAVYVHVAVAGSNPASGPGVLLRQSPGSDNWWTNIKLSPNTEYEYLYELENGKLITDPWGRQVGTYGTRFSTGVAGLSADNYSWASTGFTRPPLNRVAIYELNIGEFAGGANSLGGGQAGFTHMAKLMGHFNSLGVNAIELMPVNDYGGVGKSGFSWGYDLNSYTALEPAYGTPAEFKALVDSAHAHGIAVILDVVFNHLNDTGPLWQMLPDDVANPYFKANGDMRPNEDALYFFRDMDHWTAETQELVLASLHMWIDEYRIDGFRYDFTQGIGWSTAQPTMGILGWANTIDQEYTGAIYQIAEHLPESPALIYFSGMTSGWHDSFRDKVFDEARFRNVVLPEIESLVLGLGGFVGNDVPSSPQTYGSRMEPVNATVTHDEQSLIYEMTHYQGVGAAEAVLRDKLYGALMFTSLGVPMLWEGMEFAEPRGWDPDAVKLSYRPVQFSRLQTAEGQAHFSWYRKLIRQRLMNPALYRGTFRPLFQYTSQKVLVWGFEDAQSPAKVMVVANFRGVQHTITAVPWLGTGTWYDLASGAPFVANSTTLDSMVVPAYTALVYTTVPDTVLTGVAPGTGPEVPTEAYLAANYPNPFNPSTTIRYSVPGANGIGGGTEVRVAVYDVLGREVAVLAQGHHEPGVYSVTFNGSGQPSGMYVCSFSVGGTRQTRKMLLLK
jgi:1,4-alpha-glucan branching enzyme